MSYKFSDLILSDEAPEEIPEEHAAQKKSNPEFEYICETAEPDLVITKVQKKGSKDVIKGQMVFLVTQKQFYVQTITKGRKNPPVVCQEDDYDDSYRKAVMTFLKDLPSSPEGDKELDTGCSWMPVLVRDKTFIDAVMDVLKHDMIYRLTKMGLLKITYGWNSYSRYDYDEELYDVLEEAVKCLGQDAVRDQVATSIFSERIHGVYNSQIGDLIDMCAYEVDTRTGERSISIMHKIKERYGISGLRNMVDTFLGIINPYNGLNGFRARCIDFFGSDHNRNFDLKTLTDYMTYAPVKQGYGSFSMMSQDWNDVLNMQEQLYGKLVNKYPEDLNSYHLLLSSKCRLIERAIDKEKFRVHAEREKAFRWESDEYMIISPEIPADMTDEATQQSNCLSSYIKSFTDDVTDIYFMRYKKTPDKSLVTIEVNNGRVRQAFEACNRQITEKESRFIQKWAENFGIEYIPRQFSALNAPAA